MPREATSDRHSMSQPGVASPVPWKTTDVFHATPSTAGNGAGAPAALTHRKRVTLPCSSSIPSASTSIPCSPAATVVPMAAHGSADAATVRTASTVEVAATSRAPGSVSAR
jgi:hypothetical protein